MDATYVNCWETYERNDLLFTIADDLVGDALHRQSSSRVEWLESLREDSDHPRVVNQRKQHYETESDER